jgi:hypothetical protein
MIGVVTGLVPVTPVLQRITSCCAAPGTSVEGEAAANRQDPHH